MGLSLEPALWQKNLLCMRRALRLGGDAPPSSECKRARKAQVHLLCIELLPPERPSQHMNMVGGGLGRLGCTRAVFWHNQSLGGPGPLYWRETL